MNDLKLGDEVRYLPCLHTYHRMCIDEWLMRSFSCPTCLLNLEPDTSMTTGTVTVPRSQTQLPTETSIPPITQNSPSTPSNTNLFTSAEPSQLSINESCRNLVD
ncbi:RING finger protein 11 [Schistosoma japonicum]|nr:RING finger protein 11 [Schistosoma japonicum]